MLRPRELLTASLLTLLAACAATRPGPAPVAPEASQALAEARALRRAGAGLEDAELLRALERARYHAPDWVAPARFQDDLYLGARLGVDALVRRRAQLAHDPREARLQYLTGRLEGEGGVAHFQRALDLDRDLAWAHHGVAWAALGRGDRAAAVRSEQRAVELARDPWERAYFEIALAGHLMGQGDSAEALAVARTMLASSRLAGDDRRWLEVEVALIELRQGQSEERRAGRRRALALLRDPELAGGDIVRLVAALRFLPGGDTDGYDIELALAAVEGQERERIRAELMLSRGSSPLATRLLQRAFAGFGRGEDPLERGARFAIGDFTGAVETWVASLPGQALDEDGELAEPALARVVELARALEPQPALVDERVAQLERFGQALVDAGWFTEARSVSEVLAPLDLDAAMALRDQAVAGIELLRSIRRGLYELEDGDSSGSVALSYVTRDADETAEERERLEEQGSLDGLDALLQRVGVEIAQANVWLGGETDEGRASAELLASPRLEYGPFATLVHPGPEFSEEDQERGLGLAGQAVGGLAAEMARLGRFAVFGEYVGGGGPDGTILHRLRVEQRSGRHVGVHYSGTVAWCEGTDLTGRAARSGARISGAALHEGYWIDVDSVRVDHGRWLALAEVFQGDGASERVARVLATRGLPLESQANDERARKFERRRVTPLLGEADRVRLAVMRDRAGNEATATRPVESVSLDELVETVATHEEGHLCDRTLFLPIGKKLGRVMGLLFEEGFSPARIQRRLEYRAQLVALCSVDDPRLALVEVLAAAENGSSGPLPHASAYRELLQDLIVVLDEESLANPDAWPHVARDSTLAHQLHHLSPEEVRTLCLRLAKERKVGRL